MPSSKPWRGEVTQAQHRGSCLRPLGAAEPAEAAIDGHTSRASSALKETVANVALIDEGRRHVLGSTATHIATAHRNRRRLAAEPAETTTILRQSLLASNSQHNNTASAAALQVDNED